MHIRSLSWNIYLEYGIGPFRIGKRSQTQKFLEMLDISIAVICRTAFFFQDVRQSFQGIPNHNAPLAGKSSSHDNWHMKKSCVVSSCLLKKQRSSACVPAARFVLVELPSLKLTWPMKIDLPNRKVVFQPSIFRGYVSFREGSSLHLRQFGSKHSSSKISCARGGFHQSRFLLRSCEMRPFLFVLANSPCFGGKL